MAPMDDSAITRVPTALSGLLADTSRIGFAMASESKVGAFLAVLAATKPGGHFLELGTGTGHGTAWILGGMDTSSRLDTVDTDAAAVDIAKRHLASDARVTFHFDDGAVFIDRSEADTFDLIYADAWPGKFNHLNGAGAAARRRYLCHRRSAAAAELARGACGEHSATDRGARMPPGVCYGTYGVGVRSDDGSSAWVRLKGTLSVWRLAVDGAMLGYRAARVLAIALSARWRLGERIPPSPLSCFWLMASDAIWLISSRALSLS